MRIEFNVTGADRKRLVQAMGEILEVKPKYLGMPTAAYQVDYFHIDKNGAVEFDDSADSKEIENLLLRLAERGFTGGKSEDGKVSEEVKNPPQNASVGLTVEVPRDKVNTENLTAILDAKGGLIKKALGVAELPVEISDDKVAFPWFETADGETVKAYTHFISALCEMSVKLTRITAKAKDLENEKYAFRCFLLRLGFIGEKYKAERKILLKNLTGSSAFKNGLPAQE